MKNGSLLKADFGPGQLPAGATGPQGPAGPAGPSGLSATERVEVTTTTSSISPRNAQIQCPAGKRLLGGGTRLNGTAPTVAIQSSFPDNDNVYRVVARELVANQGTWSVTAFAICAIAS